MAGSHSPFVLINIVSYSYLCRLFLSALAIVTKAEGMNVYVLIPSLILKVYLTLFGYVV